MLSILALLVAVSPNTKEADALFSQARVLMKQGNSARACPLLEESHALDPALGTLLNLGDCYETTGRLVQAYLRFNEAAAWATRTREKSRADIARARASALKGRLAWLVLSLPATRGLSITVNGLVVGGRTVPVDEGVATIVASAPDQQPWSTTINVAPQQRVALSVPPLSDLKRPALRSF